MVPSSRARLLNLEKSRNIEISIANGLTVDGDAGLLRIVLENLFGNAVKYSAGQETSIIEFGEFESDGRVKTFYIRDNGVGFDMTHVDKLFLTFQRLHSVQEFSGNGIGLSIVERIIKKHGGSIWAEASVGEGATFYFEL